MTHISITIGPVYDTFQNVRHTREVWAASYFFSLLAKSIIVNVCIPDYEGDYVNFSNTQKAQLTSKADAFVMPSFHDSELFEAGLGVGLFPDRLIFQESILGTRKFEKILDKSLTDLAKIIAEINTKAVQTGDFINETKIAKYLKEYLRIPYLFHKVVENAIIEVSPLLDALELQPALVVDATFNPLSVFFKNVNRGGKENFISKYCSTNYTDEKNQIKIKSSNKDINDQIRFESLAEISTRELVGDTKIDKKDYKLLVNTYLWSEGREENDLKFMEALQKAYSKQFKTYHKYICVVKADGDKIGKTLQKIKSSEISNFSKKLTGWGLKVKDIIWKYGGVPIYVGGDDLLFFAPVCNVNQNIFDLIDDIDVCFGNQKWEEISQEVTPSLSYGLSISYYKKPLSEALERCESLLYEAKDLGGNAIALTILKNSETEFNLSFIKDKAFYQDQFKEILKVMVDDKALVNASAFKIRDNMALVEQIFKEEDETIGDIRLQAFFKNILDEKTENPKPKDVYLAKLRSVLAYYYDQEKSNLKVDNKAKLKESTIKTVNKTFSVVRTAKFFKGLEDVKS